MTTPWSDMDRWRWWWWCRRRLLRRCWVVTGVSELGRTWDLSFDELFIWQIKAINANVQGTVIKRTRDTASRGQNHGERVITALDSTRTISVTEGKRVKRSAFNSYHLVLGWVRLLNSTREESKRCNSWERGRVNGEHSPGPFFFIPHFIINSKETFRWSMHRIEELHWSRWLIAIAISWRWKSLPSMIRCAHFFLIDSQLGQLTNYI